ncbi:MAG: ABC transporter permease [Paracoccaceae bacterium]
MTTTGVKATLAPTDTQLPKGNRVRFQKLRVFAALVLREMTARYGRSFGGYFWAVAEPTGGVVLLALVFSFALYRPPLGNSFMVFYATGIIPFYLYNTTAASAAAAVQANRGLLTYPVVSALDTVLARIFLESLNYVMITVVLFPLLIIWDDAIVDIAPEHIAMSMFMAATLGLGIGTMNCVINGFLPTWRIIWNVLNRPLFIISGVMFPYNMIPEPARSWLWYNPLIHVVGEMRRGFYSSYDGGYISYSLVFAVSLTLFVIGGYLLRRHEGYLIEH